MFLNCIDIIGENGSFLFFQLSLSKEGPELKNALRFLLNPD